jgi:hypothetical protein
MNYYPNHPTTPKPRDRRAFNAYRHGLTGHVLVIEPADEVAYKQHCQGIHQALAPAGSLETDLVQSIADDRWRLKRAAAMESNILAGGLNKADDILSDNAEVDTALHTARLWFSAGKELERLTLYESRIQRRVEKNIALIHQLQQNRRAALQQAAEEVRLLAQLARSKGESYDAARDYPCEFLPPQFDFSTAQLARLALHQERLAEARNLPQTPPRPVRRAA